jgi:hypothetical protein
MTPYGVAMVIGEGLEMFFCRSDIFISVVDNYVCRLLPYKKRCPTPYTKAVEYHTT